MADLPAESKAIPLLSSTEEEQQQQKQEDPKEEEEEELLNIHENTHLERTLQRLESFLSLLGFNQSSPLTFCLSWFAFFVIGVSLPFVALERSDCPSSSSSGGCDEYQVRDFELVIVSSQACLGAVSLLCLSHNLRKYGLRKFLFVDLYSGQMAPFHHEYNHKISDTFRLLMLWMLPCFILKTIREVARILFEPHDSWWLSVAILLVLIISWTYVTMIYLSACILFHLLCNLQIIHSDDYGKLLETESDVMGLIKEHMRLRHHLSKISHRFRIFLLLVFLVVTSSQFMTLFQTTGYSGQITFINGGDFAVSSIVQVVGIVLCLNAAAKISHRAQGIASLASRWHAMMTCNCADASQMRASNSAGNLEAANPLRSLCINHSERDLESLDYVAIHTDTQLASEMSSYRKRQAFVLYLQMNPGGITIFGWTVDRGLINTIFFVELSLVLFVLGKTIVFAAE